MDERWALTDLHRFPHAYSQAYSFIYCLDSALESEDARRIDTALQGYPWLGGYSYVNIYTVFARQVPFKFRPTIRSIRYASPGAIDILLNADVALQIAKSVAALIAGGVAIAEAIKRIDTIRLQIAQGRRNDRVHSINVAAREAAELNRLSEEVARHLGFSRLSELNRRTKDPEVTLKLLLAHCRRLEVLADFVNDRKAKLPLNLPDDLRSGDLRTNERH